MFRRLLVEIDDLFDSVLKIRTELSERNYDVTRENRISGHFNGLWPKPAPPYPTHHLNPDIHHMCGCSGKMNSAGEYMVRKFIAHAWDEPSGAEVEVEVEGRSSPTPQALFPLYWEEQSPRIFM